MADTWTSSTVLSPTTLTMPITSVRHADLAVAGGKGVGLGELTRLGLDVPDGFVVTTDAYRLALAAAPAHPTADPLRTLDLPGAVRSAVLAAYRDLGGGAVAVRSSATAEDLPGASFAGQQDTLLGVLGQDALLDAVRTCWASLWGERAVAYRGRLGLDPAELSIAVIVQQMVDPDLAGVMFTANPVTGDRGQVVIDSSPGLGEAVVAGLVTPDHAVLDADGEVVSRTAGRADVAIVRADGGGTVQRQVAHASDASFPRLTGPVLASIASLGRRAADHFGMPMDLEWAVQGDRIAMLQARPMTALPPPPRRINRIQRLSGPVIYELFPRRPTPLELTAYLRPVVVPLVEGMLAGVTGVRLLFEEVIRDEDSVMTEFVPPSPRLSWAMPARLARSISRIGLDPARWEQDPRAQQHAAACAALAAEDPERMDWAELLGVPTRVAETTALVTALRVHYLPACGASVALLSVLLHALGRPDLLAGLLAPVSTRTTRANEGLEELADLVRADADLVALVRQGTATEAWDRLRSDPRAVPVLAEIEDFLRRYGHRETGSILLVRDPTWGQHPPAVLGILRVLLDDTTTVPPRPARDQDTVASLLREPHIRRLRIGPALAAVVRRARAGIAFREDTHFEITRPMPQVRSALLEIGRRLSAAGQLDVMEDIWFLTWAELRDTPDPATTTSLTRDLRRSAARRRTAYDERAGAPLASPLTLYPDAASTAVHGALVTGTAGGGGQATGRVRVISGVETFGELRAGEVLVCAATNPSWTPLFATAAAVVVDHGGFASHAAIVARERGLPAVMGCGDGTTVLQTGQLVAVDGDRGVVLPAPEPQVGP